VLTTVNQSVTTATILIRAVNHDWRVYLITLLTVGVVLRKPWNPLWLFAAGALTGMIGFV
jgi:hypothetical protein